MANMTTTGTTGYPGVLDTRTALTDGAAGDLIVANHPNGLGAAVIALETTLGVNPQGSVADVVTRLGVSQNTDGTIKSSVIVGGTGVTTSYSSGIFTLSASPDGAGNLQGFGLEVTANAPVANALRVRLVFKDGSTLTATNFANISFHAASSTSCLYNAVLATTDTVASLSNGSTLGFTASEFGRIYVWAINANAGQSNSVIELALSRKAIFSEDRLQSTTAEGGAGAADSPVTLYAPSARSSVPVRCLGYFDLTTGATPGQWTNTPAFGSLLGHGSKRTGDVLQYFATTSSQAKTNTGTIPYDNTPPTTAEGGLFLDPMAITPMSACNYTVIRSSHMLAHTVGNAGCAVALFQGSNTNAIAVMAARQVDSTGPYPITLLVSTITGLVASTTYHMRAGGETAGTIWFNGDPSTTAQRYGTTSSSMWELMEIMA